MNRELLVALVVVNTMLAIANCTMAVINVMMIRRRRREKKKFDDALAWRARLR